MAMGREKARGMNGNHTKERATHLGEDCLACAVSSRQVHQQLVCGSMRHRRVEQPQLQDGQ